MTFDEWVSQADEDDLRAASDFRHHYPYEQDIMDVEGELTDDGLVVGFIGEERRIIICGCNEHVGYPWGSPGHGG